MCDKLWPQQHHATVCCWYVWCVTSTTKCDSHRGKSLLELWVNHFTSRLRATLNLCLIYFKITWAQAILLQHMHKKFEVNRSKFKGGCQSGRSVVIHNSKSDLPLKIHINDTKYLQIHFKITILTQFRYAIFLPIKLNINESFI